MKLNVRWSNGGNLPYITCLPRRCLQTVWLNRLQPQHSWISGGCWTIVVDLIGYGSWLPKVGVLNRCLAPSLLCSVVERHWTLDILISRLCRFSRNYTCRSLSVIAKILDWEIECSTPIMLRGYQVGCKLQSSAGRGNIDETSKKCGTNQFSLNFKKSYAVYYWSSS